MCVKEKETYSQILFCPGSRHVPRVYVNLCPWKVRWKRFIYLFWLHIYPLLLVHVFLYGVHYHVNNEKKTLKYMCFSFLIRKFPQPKWEDPFVSRFTWLNYCSTLKWQQKPKKNKWLQSFASLQ